MREAWRSCCVNGHCTLERQTVTVHDTGCNPSKSLLCSLWYNKLGDSWTLTFTKTFVTNFFSPAFYKQEVAPGGCLRDAAKSALAAANPFGSDYSPSSDVGAGAMGFGDASRLAQATKYAVQRGLVVERRSSTFRKIRGGAKTTLAEGALAYADASMAQGVVQEFNDARSGACK